MEKENSLNFVSTCLKVVDTRRLRIQPLGSGDQYAYEIYDKTIGGKIQYSVIPKNP